MFKGLWFWMFGGSGDESAPTGPRTNRVEFTGSIIRRIEFAGSVVRRIEFDGTIIRRKEFSDG